MADASERIIILSALLLVVILGGVRVWYPDNQDQSETTIDTMESNIIFRYGVSGGKHPNELDTIRGYFQKDMVNKEPAWTRMDLTQEEMDTIHRMMVEIDFFSYPKGFHPKLEGAVTGSSDPFSVYYLEYRNETVSKVVYWNTQFVAPEDTQYNNLRELAQLIIELIQAKPEYQKLPKPTAGYA